MRVIGIDPGLRRTGWGVVDVAGARVTHVANGVCLSTGSTLAERLCSLYAELARVIAAYRPDAAAVEQTFVSKDAVATLKLGQARGIALLAPAQAGLSVAEYAPNAIKKVVVGVGHAEKAQVEHMVRLQLPGAVPAGPDAADALAVALCHAHHAHSRTGSRRRSRRRRRDRQAQRPARLPGRRSRADRHRRGRATWCTCSERTLAAMPRTRRDGGALHRPPGARGPDAALRLRDAGRSASGTGC